MSFVCIYCASVYLSCNPRLVILVVIQLFSRNGFTCNINDFPVVSTLKKSGRA